ncbi:PH domain-containing protein [Pseudonocardia nigra]|uniref:PH domain-containing protein n=1 Tax=Pseudonocardia nigra TaxID=1921578 RepID=UPI001C601415|nr:PH domain-containing protein [Pseudonocardia nigra]
MTEQAPFPQQASMTDAAPPAVQTPWRRLDKRMLVVSPLGSAVRLLPVAVILLFTGQGDVTTRLWIPLVFAVLVVIAGVARWRTTRYRITAERVELHSGWLRKQRRSVPRDRIRSVDLTARLLHRAFGLSVVQVSAGSGAVLEQSGLSLDAVSKAEAERLRRELLDHRSPVAPDPAQQTPQAPPAEELAGLQWSWLRFAPLTFSSLAGVGAVGAAVFNLVDDLGVDPRDIGVIEDATDRLATAPIWLGVAVVGVGLLVTAVVGALILFAERWYDYRLTREPSRDGALPAAGTPVVGTGTLRVKRGLLTRRSLSVAEQRLRGTEIVEPLLLRAGRGAQCRALSTGLARDGQGGALQPPAPRAEAHRVASAVLREHPAQITGAPLRAHPRAALVRRMSRALVPVVVLVAGAFLLGWAVPAVAWLGPASLVLLPLAALLGLDRYRNLGHELTARYLVARQGSLQRQTVALQRAGVIGWTFRQSIFQRRSGLVAVEAITAAGAGGYTVLDVAAPDGVALADAATPHLLTPFLARPNAEHRAG